MIGHVKDLVRTMDGQYQFSFVTRDNGAPEQYEAMADKVVDVTLKVYRPRRSLDANAYAWVLIDKIAHEQGIGKKEVYREAIRNIGGVSDVLCMQTAAVDQFRRIWERNGIGYQTEIMPSKLPGCTNVVAYYGSSTYDTKQMSALIDQLVQDAKAQGIETRTPEQIESLISDWRERDK